MKKINLKEMTRAQLDHLGAAAEKVAFRNSRPLTARARQAIARAGRKAGRPRVGAGARRINITVEQSLLTHADAYARKNGMSRAAVVAEGLKRILAA